MSANNISPTVLALMGDAVFSLFVRQRVISRCDGKSGLITVRCNALVNAKSQARMLAGIEDMLTPEESDIARRCRNAHTNNKAKSATLSEYKASTALEGVLGWLYLCGEHDRCNEIMHRAVSVVEEQHRG